MSTAWDVIVVGAGPAGAIAARRLARAGARTLLVERARLPRDKMCCGIVSQQSQALLQEEFGPGFNFPTAVCAWPSPGSGAKIQRQRGGAFLRVPESFHNTWRRDFDFWLTLKAQEAGAELWAETSFLGFGEASGPEVRVRLQGRPLARSRKQTFLETCRYLVGADGGTSRVRRRLLPPGPADTPYQAIYQVYLEGRVDLDPRYMHMFWDPGLPYQGFVTCKDGLVIPGVSCPRPGPVRAHLREFMAFLAASHGLERGRRVMSEACLMPRFYSLKKMIFNYCFGRGRVLLAGEAAGLFDITMEGIPAALASGRDAALSILEALAGEGEALALYQKRARKLSRALLRSFHRRQGQSFLETSPEEGARYAAP